MAIQFSDLVTLKGAPKLSLMDLVTAAEVLIYEPSTTQEEIDDAIALVRAQPDGAGWADSLVFTAGEWRSPKHKL